MGRQEGWQARMNRAVRGAGHACRISQCDEFLIQPLQEKSRATRFTPLQHDAAFFMGAALETMQLYLMPSLRPPESVWEEVVIPLAEFGCAGRLRPAGKKTVGHIRMNNG